MHTSDITYLPTLISYPSAYSSVQSKYVVRYHWLQ